ncbi:c-type cytochrome [Pricia antarctica]|uniref:c-type cytochrome n=1 Tax=Pricia antarctica TaxID=641691 RepID=UPI000B8527C0|nr:c-type cytochrome [Pricia antarctica]
MEDPFIQKGSKSHYFRGNAPTSDALSLHLTSTISSNQIQDKSLPNVKLSVSPNSEEYYHWDTDVRYSIEVSDAVDGDSKYGEININEVLLEIEFLPKTDREEGKEIIKISDIEPDDKGLSLLKKSTCFNCHADKTVLAGPSFSKIAERYKNTAGTIKSLSHRILNGSIGEWGSMEMPAHPDLTSEETEQMASYILLQGGKKNNWVLPGLEGTFRIIKKPGNVTEGIYMLTASYTSTSLMKGQFSRKLHIK